MQARVFLTLVLVQFMFASMAIAGKLVFPAIPPTGLVVLRIAGALGVLLLAAAVIRLRPIENRRDWLRLALLGLLGVAGNQTLFLMGLDRTTAINASILATLIPVFTVLFSVLAGLEAVSAGKIGGILLAGAGAVYLIGPDRVSLAPDLVLGNLLVVLATMSYSGFLVLSKPVLARYDTLTVSTWMLAFGLPVTAIIGARTLVDLDWSGVDPSTWFWVGFIVLVPTVGAYFLNAWVLKRTSSQLVAAYIYLQPLVVVAIAPAVLDGERLTSRTALAAGAIFLGLAIVIWAETRGKRQPPGAAGYPVGTET